MSINMNLIAGKCNIVLGGTAEERTAFAKDFLGENPEAKFIMQPEIGNSKKTMFGPKTIFDIIKKSKSAKGASSSDISKMLEDLKITHLRDRAPTAMSGGQKIKCSMAMQILAGKCTFLFVDGQPHLDPVLSSVATGVPRGVTVVWVTSYTAEEIMHNDNTRYCNLIALDEQSQSVIDKKIAEENEKKTVKEPVKKPEPLFNPELYKTATYIPEIGKVCRTVDHRKLEAVVLAIIPGGNGNRKQNDVLARELDSGELIKWTIGWNAASDSPRYSSTQYTITPREDGEKVEFIHDTVYYRKTYTGLLYENLECEMHYCKYIGDYKCKDVFTGEIYSPKFTQVVKKELDTLKTGDFVSVCLKEEAVYFGASYEIKTHVAMNTKTKSGDYALLWADSSYPVKNETIYMEENDLFVELNPKENQFYTYYETVGFKREFNTLQETQFYSMKLLPSNRIYWIAPAEEKIKTGKIELAEDDMGWLFISTSDEKYYNLNTSGYTGDDLASFAIDEVVLKANVFDTDDSVAILQSDQMAGKRIYSLSTMDDYDTLEPMPEEIRARIENREIFAYYPELDYYMPLGN